MANDQPSFSFPSSSIVVVLLALTGAFYIYRDAPLQGVRPNEAETQIHQTNSSEKIAARLWQDPFAAVARARWRESNSSERLPKGFSHCDSELLPKDFDSSTTVLGVMVPGGGYAELSETRRRIRYAVLSALEKMNFIAEVEDHIGCWKHPEAEHPIPFEWFRDHKNNPLLILWLNEDVLGQDLEDDKLTHVHSPQLHLKDVSHQHPLDGLSALLNNTRSSTKSKVAILGFNVAILGPFTSDTLATMIKEASATPKPAAEGQESRAKHNSTHSRHLKRIYAKTSISSASCPIETNATEWPQLKNVPFYAYGPTIEPETLKAELRGILPCWDNNIENFFKSKGVTFHRTLAGDGLLAAGLRDELKQRGVDPTHGQDHIALIGEWDTIYGRTFAPTLVKAFDASCVSEDDAKGEVIDSGRCSWVHILKYARGLDGALPHPLGVDQSSGDKGQAANADALHNAPGKESEKARQDALAFDRPYGQGQQDYLRRMAKSLKQGEADSGQKIRAIGVVGNDVFDKLLVLRAFRHEFPDAIFFTTDFDYALTMPSELGWTRNLLVASSFGPTFRPEIQGGIPPFRGSYEASAFLAAQLALRDMAGQPAADNRPKKDLAEILERWASGVRIFEIDRKGNALPLNGTHLRSRAGADWREAAPPPTPSTLHGADEAQASEIKDKDQSHNPQQWDSNCAKTLLECWSVNPPPGASNSEMKRISYALVAVLILMIMMRLANSSRHSRKRLDSVYSFASEIMALIVISIATSILIYGIYALMTDKININDHNAVIFGFTLVCTWLIFILIPVILLEYFQNYGRRTPETPSVEIVFAYFSILTIAVVCWFWSDISSVMSRQGKGELMEISGGVSLWPVIALRFMTLLFTIVLLVRGIRKLKYNVSIIAKEMRLQEPSLVLSKFRENARSSEESHSLGIRYIANIYYFIKNAFSTRAQLQAGSHVEDMWGVMIQQGRFQARLFRVLVFSFFTFLSTWALTIIVSYLADSQVNVPNRDYTVKLLYLIITSFEFFFMLAILFFVFDATLSLWFFVKQLGERSRVWQIETQKEYGNKLGIIRNNNALEYWLDIEFIAKRTQCIGDLIYYPFFILAIFLASRNSVFANFSLSLSIIVPLLLLALLLFSCAFLLRNSAETTRSAAKKAMADALLRAKKNSANAQDAAQLETLLHRVEDMQEGAFLPILQQPPIRAVLLPLASAGLTLMADFGLIPTL